MKCKTYNAYWFDEILFDCYRSIWEKVFSGKYAVKDAWDIRARFGRSPRHRVCFRDLTVGIYGPAAPITIHTWETPCRGTALVRAYSDFVIRGLNLQVRS